MTIKPGLLAIAFSLFISSGSHMAMASPAEPLNAVGRLPVREVTVFKDGHAFVLHEGKMPTDEAGNVVMDYLPCPVLGTFWPYCLQKNAKMTSVVASRRKVLVPRTALTIPELVEANPGADVNIHETSGTGLTARTVSYDATIGNVPTRTSEELENTSPPNGGEKLPQKSPLVVLKTQSGHEVLPLDRIETLAFKNGYNKKISEEEFRNLLNLGIKWDSRPEKSAEVGMVYLQNGLRWIPNYKVNFHSDGTADVKLQATFINELADLNDVTTNLVIGVPSFAFANETDPMALEQTVARLSPCFSESSKTANAFSNAIMSQAESAVGTPISGTVGSQRVDANPEISGAGANEDLFIFTVQHVFLKKGQRMVLPIADYTLKYKDVYTLEIPYTPPPDVRMQYQPPEADLAKLLAEPKVMHAIRLTNKSAYPLTTAPALILKDDKLIAQGLMTYTGINGQCDLKLTAKVDVKVKKTEQEIKRTPDAIRWQRDSYGRVDLSGKITMTNYSAKPIEVEVKRLVLGKFGEVDSSGKVQMLNTFEDDKAGLAHPHWWSWYDWPSWWNRVNSVSTATWNVVLPPDKHVELDYGWYYFWH